MKLLVFSSDGEMRKRLLTAINAFASQCTLETFGDIRSLNLRLRREFTGNVWLVLVIADLKELGRVTAMGELIRYFRIIVVLPDQRPETVSAGHALYPRFVSYLSSDFSDVCSVLRKIIDNNKAQ